MSKTLVMNFLNEEGKKTAVRVSNVKENVTEAEVSAAMDVINDTNILCDDISRILDKSNSIQDHRFDDLIISDMVVNESYQAFIKDELSKEEDNVFSSYISGQDFEDYAIRKGIKP